ncbi:LysR family transcriptional regulator [Microbacterium gorillae]|uniref:LysR family transcriptional regulator n=1 Tax=Microbacterium gorillae TaxID=1231063 RepID=UPI0006943BDA|nr:LysR family transcriptional regulator [Microbacterium gorillae]
MNLELRHYRLFATVAQTQSFSAAARVLGMSQPAVSRGVAVIERQLGTQLVERTTRRFTLTRAGATLHAEAQRVLDAAEAAEAATIRSGTGQVLVVGVKADSAGDFLPRLLNEYASASEGVRVEVDFRETHELATAVTRGACDACVVAWPITAHGLAWLELWSEPRVAVIPHTHPLATADSLHVKDLVQEPVARWPHLPEDLDRYYQGRDTLAVDAASVTGPAVRGLAETLRLVELGKAITFLPQSVAERFQRPQLVARHVTGLSCSRMFLGWRDQPLTPEIEQFIRTCRRLASNGPSVSAATQFGPDTTEAQRARNGFNGG